MRMCAGACTPVSAHAPCLSVTSRAFQQRNNPEGYRRAQLNFCAHPQCLLFFPPACSIQGPAPGLVRFQIISAASGKWQFGLFYCLGRRVSLSFTAEKGCPGNCSRLCIMDLALLHRDKIRMGFLAYTLSFIPHFYCHFGIRTRIFLLVLISSLH